MDAAPDIFRALSDDTRRGLFERLVREGQLTVSDLTREAGVSQPAVSQHLKALRAAGLVSEQRQGRTVLYRPRAEGLRPLVDWLGFHAAFWAEHMDRLERLLEEMDT